MTVGKPHIRALVEYFVKKYAEELACPVKRVPAEAMERLEAYPWPGGIGELEEAIKRAFLLDPRGELLGEVVLPEAPTAPAADEVEGSSLEEIVRQKLNSFLSKWEGYEISDLYEEVLKRVERPLIELILERTKGKKVPAAKILGINRNTLHKKIKELKISTRP